MEKRRAHMRMVGFGTLGVLSAIVVACGSGSGALVEPEAPYDPATNSRESPGTSNESPGSTSDVPPSNTDNPGGQGRCPPCDGTFTCTTVLNGVMKSTTLVLKSIGGVCTSIDSKGASEGAIGCDGNLVNKDGTSAGTWQPSGADGFSATSSETVTSTTNGKTTTTTVTGTVTCTRTSSSTTPPTSTSTSTTPSATGTSVTGDAGKGG